jgi:multicomponent Na+:H+ antiporter subunit D
MTDLASLPVVVPLAVAPLLITLGLKAPRWFDDATGLGTATAVMVICMLLVRDALASPFAYWLGGWRPSRGDAIGIGLSIDPLGAGLATFAAIIVLAALAYSVHYFDAAGGLYHGLMLLFMAGMVGFCLTGDLFNLIVFFELMSAVAFALTAYRIEERAPIQGAINFAITNSIGGYTMFIAAALLYARTGALNMAQIGAALNHQHSDPLIIVAFVLLLLGFLTKAAVVPLHFWLADAHAVAPTPVCVLFSGVMVELGIYAVARIYWVIFAGPLGAHAAALRVILIAMGVITALLGAWMCFVQRHLKRMLAFSTVAHVGVFLCGFGLLSAKGLAGTAVSVVGHGFAKAALFMLTGTLLHRFGTVDEFDLHGRGRQMRLVGALFVIGGLLLGGVPPLTEAAGGSLIDSAASDAGYGWLIAVFAVVSALTAGAVLRIAGRVFIGWGPAEGPDPAQARAAEERVDEERSERDRTPPVMIIVPAVLLLAAIVMSLIPGAVPGVQRAAAQFVDHRAYAQWVLHGVRISLPRVAADHAGALSVLVAVGSLLGAVALAALGLFGRPLREALPDRISVPARTGLRGLRALHSGHIGDYIAWWTLGAGTLGAVCLLALRH